MEKITKEDPHGNEPVWASLDQHIQFADCSSIGGAKMKNTIADSNLQTRLTSDLSLDREHLAELLRQWRQKLGYLSVIAACPAILGTSAQGAISDETKKPDVSVAGRIPKRLERLNNNCSKPEFLRRQRNYFLPHQRNKYNVVSAFTGGDNCPGSPIPSGAYTAAAPFSDTGDTTGANNTVSRLCYYYCYYNYNVQGPDLVYSFTLSSRGPSPEIRVTPTSGTFNPAIYVLDGRYECPAGPGADAYSWRVRADSSGPGAAEILSSEQVNSLPLNVPLHLFIDSSANAPADSGPYTLRLQDVSIASGPRIRLDYDGDGKADISVFRPSEGRWYLNRSNTGIATVSWGLNGDKPLPADYDGDGKTDAAVWRPSDGKWYVINSETNTFSILEWGLTGDIPILANFDGDSRSDRAVWRPSEGKWYVNNGSGLQVFGWGLTGDVPIPRDYNGDGKTDLAIYRNGQWWIVFNNGSIWRFDLGVTGDVAVPEDYDGDGRVDIAIWRPTNGNWYALLSGSNYAEEVWGTLGLPGDIPVPGDYTGDGLDDIAVWRPSNGKWYIRKDRSGFIYVYGWGLTGDIPIAAPNSN